MSRSVFIVTAVITALLLAAAEKTCAQTVEQRLGGTLGALIVENARLATELDAAKQTIAQLRAEIEKMKSDQPK